MIKAKVRKKSPKSKSCTNIIIIDAGVFKKHTGIEKKLNLAINMSCTGLIAIGTVAGALTANPAIIGSISGVGLAVKTFSVTKDYKRKIEMIKFPYTTYQKVLLDLRTALRGGAFHKDDYLKELNILDDTIVDFLPLVTKFEKQYAKQFLSHPTDPL